MQINITGHHVDVTEPLKAYVDEKMQKLTRHFSMITNAHVVLTVEKPYLHKAEAHVFVSQKEIHAAAEAEDMYAAIDSLIDKLDRQVIKHKEKLNNHDDDL